MGRVALVTGMSGAGRTTALKALEDIGFEAVDNLPATLLNTLIRPGDQPERALAVGIDCRTRAFNPARLQRLLEHSRRGERPSIQVLFLDCEDEILRRRFTETRRRHPLAIDRAVMDGIQRERALLAPLREHADLVIDTSQLTAADLRRLLVGLFGEVGRDRLTLSIISFAYRNGLPREADLVFDVRFLANPHYVDELRPHTGRDHAVRQYIEADPLYAPLLERLEALLDPLLPAYRREGKSYLTLAFGCTGGRHRSVAVADSFAERLRGAGWPVHVFHRDTPEANDLAGVARAGEATSGSSQP